MDQLIHPKTRTQSTQCSPHNSLSTGMIFISVSAIIPVENFTVDFTGFRWHLNRAVACFSEKATTISLFCYPRVK